MGMYSLSTNDLMILSEHMHDVGKQIIDDPQIADRGLGYQLQADASRLRVFTVARVKADPAVLELLSHALRLKPD